MTEITNLDFGLEESTSKPPVIEQVPSPFDHEFRQGKFYVFKTGDIYQFLTGYNAYHLLERIKNGVHMHAEYVGITDCASFKEEKTKSELNEIEIELLSIRKEINNYPNLDTIPKDTDMYMEVKSLWDKFFVLNKKKTDITKNTGSNSNEENIKIEVDKARKYTQSIYERAKQENWDEEDIYKKLYPNTQDYDKFTPNADKATRRKILESAPEII